MNVYVGTSGVLKNAYIGEYITQEFTPIHEQNTVIGKNGYKIQKITMEGSFVNAPSSGTYVFKAYDVLGAATADLVISVCGSGYWSSGDTVYRALSRDNPSGIIKYIPASACTSSNTAYRVEWEKDKYILYVGQTYGNWLYTYTSAYDTTTQNNINKIFDSQTAYIRQFSAKLTMCKAIVEYTNI